MKTLIASRCRGQTVASALGLVIAAALTGCVTRGYKMAPKSTPPVTALNLSAAQPSVDATLQTVIVYKGPGSWKREAYWDEYVLSIANRGTVPLTFASAALHPAEGEPVAPGDNPWALEKLSKKWWQTNAARQGGTYLALGAGATVGGAAVVATFWSTSAGAVTVGTVGATAFLAMPVVAVGTMYANVHNKHKVAAEFARRRLVLPVTIAPGGTVQGSLFFRVTPAPRQLVLSGRSGDETRDLLFDLSPLAGLHLKAPAGAASATPTGAGPST